MPLVSGMPTRASELQKTVGAAHLDQRGGGGGRGGEGEGLPQGHHVHRQPAGPGEVRYGEGAPLVDEVPAEGARYVLPLGGGVPYPPLVVERCLLHPEGAHLCPHGVVEGLGDGAGLGVVYRHREAVYPGVGIGDIDLELERPSPADQLLEARGVEGRHAVVREGGEGIGRIAAEHGDVEPVGLPGIDDRLVERAELEGWPGQGSGRRSGRPATPPSPGPAR